MQSADFVESVGLPLLAHRLRRLSEAMVSDVGQVFTDCGLKLPPQAGSLVMLLDRCGELPITTAATKLKLSHPLVISLARSLGEAGLLVAQQDIQDSRRRLLSLSSAGHELAHSLYEFNRSVSSTFEEMFEEAGIDLYSAVQAFEKVLKRRSLGDRLVERLSASSPENS